MEEVSFVEVDKIPTRGGGFLYTRVVSLTNGSGRVLRAYPCYRTGTGDDLSRVHGKDECVSEHCVLHRPSEHPLVDRPTHWRFERALMERICEHGVGHPDPDHLTAVALWTGNPELAEEQAVHGCDGCCGGWVKPEIPEVRGSRGWFEPS